MKRRDLLPSFGFIVLLILFNSNNNSLPAIYAAQTEGLDGTAESNSLDQPKENRSSILNREEDSTRAEPSDLSRAVQAVLPPEIVAEEMSSLNPEEMANYPLHELSSDDIVTTLNLLSDQNLEKVLGNIKPDNLKIIFDKIGPEMHQSVLNRLNPELKNEILNTTGIGT